MTRGAGAGDGACWSTRDPRDRAAGRRGASRGGTRRGSTAVRVGAGWCVCVARSRSAQHQVRTPQALHAPAGGPPRRGSGCCCVHTLRPADAAASCPTRRVGGARQHGRVVWATRPFGTEPWGPGRWPSRPASGGAARGRAAGRHVYRSRGGKVLRGCWHSQRKHCMPPAAVLGALVLAGCGRKEVSCLAVLFAWC